MHYIGEISALLTAILWSATSIFFSEASLRAGSLQVNITRLILATIYLAITIPIMNLSLSLSSSQIINLVLSGIIGLIFGDTYLFKAFQHIGPRLSMLVMSLAPAVAAILAYFFLGEDISLLGIFGIIITIAGIAIVVLQREEHPTSKYKISKIGILYAFFGAVGQGVGLIFAKLAFNEGEINSFVAAFFRIFSSVIIMLPIALLTKKYDNPFKVFSKDKIALAFTTAGSICGPYLGITLSLVAISNTSVGIAATIMSIVPILLLPIVRIYYKEKLTWISIVGAFITVGGIAILFLR
ncbi:MAG: DMT family transporter [Ignavibacteriales bacterium]|nr:DMT family transporter [Ignavibacteriales bacterium]